MNIECDYRKDDLECWPRPSELELARLAAQLARTEKIEPQQLVKEAWALYWESCRTLKEDDRKVEEYFKQIEAADDHQYDGPDAEEAEPVPMPKKFPVTYQKVEMLLLPKLKGRTADRAKIMREFLFVDYVRSQHSGMKGNDGAGIVKLTQVELDRLREQSEEERASLFGQLRTMTFNANEYALFAQYFLAWHRQSAGFIKSMVRANSARKRWSERRKQHQTKIGARPKLAALKEIMDPARKAT
jgi:hypothetical protein